MQGLKKHWKWVVAIIAMQFITMGTVGVAPHCTDRRSLPRQVG